jgi:hypothetical protein
LICIPSTGAAGAAVLIARGEKREEGAWERIEYENQYENESENERERERERVRPLSFASHLLQH